MKQELADLVRTFEALGPLVGNAVKSGQLLSPRCELTEPDPNILSEYDVRIPMSEGFSVTANIYRSKTAAEKGDQVPVVMCVHPYDNHLTPALKKTPLHGAPQQYRLIPQVGTPVFSKQTSWESPDPNFWVPAGYAIVNMNLPGYANSDGLGSRKSASPPSGGPPKSSLPSMVRKKTSWSPRGVSPPTT